MKVVRSDVSFGIFAYDLALVLATLLAPQLVHLRLDLRPLGINVYDDGPYLRVGGQTFSGASVQGAPAAALLS